MSPSATEAPTAERYADRCERDGWTWRTVLYGKPAGSGNGSFSKRKRAVMASDSVLGSVGSWLRPYSVPTRASATRGATARRSREAPDFTLTTSDQGATVSRRMGP